MIVGAIQMNSGAEKGENVATAVRLIQEAAGRRCELIVLPEVFNYRGDWATQGLATTVAEEVSGPSIGRIRDVARALRVYVVAGSIYEKVPDSTKVYNTSVLIGQAGEVLAIYRKIHLFDSRVPGADVSESAVFLPGFEPTVAAVGEMKAGMAICVDLRFPELFGGYRDAGVDLICVPSSFTRRTGEAHWEVLLRARAIETGCYIVAPNQAGVDGNGILAYGNSMVVDPWGTVLLKGDGTAAAVLVCELRQDLVKRCRSLLPRS